LKEVSVRDNHHPARVSHHSVRDNQEPEEGISKEEIKIAAGNLQTNQLYRKFLKKKFRKKLNKRLRVLVRQQKGKAQKLNTGKLSVKTQRKVRKAQKKEKKYYL